MSSRAIIPAYAVIVRDDVAVPSWEVAFRLDRRAAKRKIGPAWIAPAESPDAKPGGETYKDGKWVQRRGRAADGFLTYDAAVRLVPGLIADHREQMAKAARAAEALVAELQRPRTFRELARDWRESLDRKGTKPSTLVGYDAMLRDPGERHGRGTGETRGYIMAALGGTLAADVTAADVEGLLARIAATGATPRTVEKHRIMVRSILNYGIKQTERARAGKGAADGHDYGLTTNAAKVAQGPRQVSRGVVRYYRPEEVEAIARALADGKHRDRTKRAIGEGEAALRAAEDAQDAEAVRIAAYTGLRLGELLALRWSDVDWEGSALTVSRAVSAGQITTPKSGKVRRVPLPDQAAAALDRLSRRFDFTGPDELIFCNLFTGRSLDGSALRRRYKAAQAAAGVHELRWHDLRHTYGSLLAASGEELVTIKSAMGHAKITTTEVYLHARPATESAGRFTRAFATSSAEAIESQVTA